MVGPDRVLAAAQPLDAVDVQHVRADAVDPRAQLDEEAAEVLHVRLAGGVEIIVSPGASTAAMTAFSVAITLASSRKIRVPRSRPARSS